MPINQAYPSLNDITPSWADIGVTLQLSIGPAPGPALPMASIKGIKWSRKVDVGEQRGANGGRVIAQTTGQLTNEASMELYKDGNQIFMTALTAAALAQGYVRGNQAIIGLVRYDITIQYTPPGSLLLFETAIKGCRYLSDDDDAKEGTDPSTVTISMKPIEIASLINGVEAVLL
jgi:hypothetical protein